MAAKQGMEQVSEVTERVTTF